MAAYLMLKFGGLLEWSGAGKKFRLDFKALQLTQAAKRAQCPQKACCENQKQRHKWRDPAEQVESTQAGEEGVAVAFRTHPGEPVAGKGRGRNDQGSHQDHSEAQNWQVPFVLYPARLPCETLPSA